MRASSEQPPTYSAIQPPPAYRPPHQILDILFVARSSDSKTPYLKILVDGNPTYHVKSRRHAYIGATTSISMSTVDGEEVGRCKVSALRKGHTLEIDRLNGAAPTIVVRIKSDGVDSLSGKKHIASRYAKPPSDAFRYTHNGQGFIWRPKAQAYVNGRSSKAVKGIDEEWDRSAMELVREHETATGESETPEPDMAALQETKMTLYHYAPMTFIPPPPRPDIWSTGRPIARIQVFEDTFGTEATIMALLSAVGIEKLQSDHQGLGQEADW